MNEAKVKGKLIDLGGAHSVEVWFVWDTDYHDSWQNYTYSNATNKETMTQSGDFEYIITGLTPKNRIPFPSSSFQLCWNFPG